MSSNHSEVYSNILVGENGDLSHETSGCLGLDFSFKLVRGLSKTEIESKVLEIIGTGDVNQIVDLFVLMFVTRNCRGGKGERDLFVDIFLSLYTLFPSTCHSLLPLIPKFGRWGDLVTIAENSDKLGVLDGEFYDFSNPIPRYHRGLSSKVYLKDICMRELGKQIAEDHRKSKDSSISLAAKWAPRENGAFQKRHSIAFDAYVNEVLGNLDDDLSEKQKRAKVRKIVSSLTTRLDVTEQKMCSHRYSEINYETIPSVCLNKFRKAHLNEKITSEDTISEDTISEDAMKRTVSMGSKERNTGDRFPDDEDRVLGRKHLLETTRNGGIKGGQLHPHDIVSKFLYQYSSSSWRKIGVVSKLSSSEKELLEAQWVDLRSKLSSKDFGNMIAIADVSGSMNYGVSNVRPIEVSVALAILLSEVCHPAFRNRAITFSETPSWVIFSPTDTLEQKIQKVTADHNDAGNTNLIRTFEMIIEVARENNLRSEDFPTLVIFSDMQFDSAVTDFTLSENKIPSTFAIIDGMFSQSGFKRPKIVYWNLNCKDSGTPVLGIIPDTVLLSGYSPSLFKYLLFDEEVEEMTPLTIYRNMIDDEQYDDVRSILSSSNEGCLFSYRF